VIWWLLVWLRSDPGVVTPPTPDPLPFLRRDGSQFSGTLPTFIRRSN
jgi:hypothetical protein